MPQPTQAARVKLLRAVASDSDWRGAILEQADLRGLTAIAAEFTLASAGRADWRGARLRASLFDRADLEGADLREADLSEAFLEGANLAGADLRGADLRGARMAGARIEGARFEGAQSSQRGGAIDSRSM